ncbi:MAG TPA: DUF3311 domain-containing protein [Streptosporangiales bacterium]
MVPVDRRPRRRVHLLLLVLPFVWQLVLAPAVNGVRLTLLGVPFPMLWQMLGVVFASVVIGVVFRLDRRAGVDADDEAFLAATTRGDGEDAR